MDYMFDHTTIIAEDDGIIQLRIIPAVGAEQFARYIYKKLNTFVQEETNGRVKVSQVEFMEHNKNTAIFREN
jgi:6-pyruvoyltetrahydropterin/6-carboxytetrahydropterin synthase